MSSDCGKWKKRRVIHQLKICREHPTQDQFTDGCWSPPQGLQGPVLAFPRPSPSRRCSQRGEVNAGLTIGAARCHRFDIRQVTLGSSHRPFFLGGANPKKKKRISVPLPMHAPPLPRLFRVVLQSHWRRS